MCIFSGFHILEGRSQPILGLGFNSSLDEVRGLMYCSARSTKEEEQVSWTFLRLFVYLTDIYIHHILYVSLKSKPHRFKRRTDFHSVMY